jgi:hypothetical protein
MKLLCHLIILLFSFCAFTSNSQAQENDTSAGVAALSIRATATPASIIQLSANPNNTAVSATNSSSAGTVRVSLRDADADIVRQTADGTLYLNRVEIFVRFSGFSQETANVLVMVAGVDDSTSGQALREGATPETSNSILTKQTIEVRGVKSGETIVRYIGFLVSGDSGRGTAPTPLGAEVRYQITAP